MFELLPILLVTFLAGSLLIYAAINAGIVAWNRYEQSFTETTENKLQGLFLFADSRKILLLYLLAAALVPTLVWLLAGSFFYLVVVVVAIMVLPKTVFKRLEEKRRKDISSALPDALAQTAGAMQAGATFNSALQSMVDESEGPIKQEFSLLLREIRVGIKLEDALDNLGERVCSEDMDLVISAALIARDVGGNLAEIFLRLSDTLRSKHEMEQKISALTSQGIMQGWVVSLLPFAIMFALKFVEPEAIEPIWNTLLGWIFLTVIIVLELIGGFVIKKIVSIDI